MLIIRVGVEVLPEVCYGHVETMHHLHSVHPGNVSIHVSALQRQPMTL